MTQKITKKFSALDWLWLFITGYRYPSTHNCAMCRYNWPVSVPVQQHDVHDGGAGEHGRCPPLHGPTSAPEIFREVLGEQSSSAQAEVVVNYEQWGFQPFPTLLKETVQRDVRPVVFHFLTHLGHLFISWSIFAVCFLFRRDIGMCKKTRAQWCHWQRGVKNVA